MRAEGKLQLLSVCSHTIPTLDVLTWSRTQTFYGQAVVHASYSNMIGSGYEINMQILHILLYTFP